MPLTDERIDRIRRVLEDAVFHRDGETDTYQALNDFDLLMQWVEKNKSLMTDFQLPE